MKERVLNKQRAHRAFGGTEQQVMNKACTGIDCDCRYRLSVREMWSEMHVAKSSLRQLRLVKYSIRYITQYCSQTYRCKISLRIEFIKCKARKQYFIIIP